MQSVTCNKNSVKLRTTPRNRIKKSVNWLWHGTWISIESHSCPPKTFFASTQETRSNNLIRFSGQRTTMEKDNFNETKKVCRKKQQKAIMSSPTPSLSLHSVDVRILMSFPSIPYSLHTETEWKRFFFFIPGRQTMMDNNKRDNVH